MTQSKRSNNSPLTTSSSGVGVDMSGNWNPHSLKRSKESSRLRVTPSRFTFQVTDKLSLFELTHTLLFPENFYRICPYGQVLVEFLVFSGSSITSLFTCHFIWITPVPGLISSHLRPSSIPRRSLVSSSIATVKNIVKCWQVWYNSSRRW